VIYCDSHLDIDFVVFLFDHLFMKLKIIVALLTLTSFLMFFNKKSLAVDYFSDSFSIPDSNKWHYYCNFSNKIECESDSQNISFLDGSMNLSTNTSDFPVVLTKDIVFPKNKDFVLKIRFRYTDVTDRGVGIGVGFTGPTGELFSQFGIWNDRRLGLRFYYNDFSSSASQGYCSDFTNTKDPIGRETIPLINLGNFSWHVFEINKKDGYYEVYLDRELNSDPIFTKEIKNNCIPDNVWFGNFISDGGGRWTEISIDNIAIFSETLLPDPTLTPIPTPVIRNKKVFVLPGLGASWNSDAIVYDKSVGNSDWKMTPFVNNYDGLISLLESNDLVSNKDYFVWNYDWRKSIYQIVDDFDAFVNSKNLSSTDDIYLVGHSLGGVVARFWAQDHLDDDRIVRVINLGSPNMGSVNSYSVWNGGRVSSINGMSSVMFQILLTLKGGGLTPNISKIRSYAPVVKDLLPVFDYTLKNGVMISWKDLETKNAWLEDGNRNVSKISDKFDLSIGKGQKTLSTIKLGHRNTFDKALGLWPDGRILKYSTNNDGDGTVLVKSASFGSDNKFEIDSSHGEIINKSLDLVADKIGLNKISSIPFKENYRDGLVVFVGSPVKSFLRCGDKTFEEVDGFIWVEDKDYEKCQLELSPTGTGKVHIAIGNIKTNKWNYIEKEVMTGGNEKISINYDTAGILVDKENSDFLISSIRNDLNELGLSRAIKFLDRNNFIQVANYVFGYRLKNREYVVSQRILDNLYLLSSIKSKDVNRVDYRWLNQYVSFVKRMVEFKSRTSTINERNANSFLRLEELLEKVDLQIKDGKYPSSSMVVHLAVGYATEALSK
jgi:pimeloyl-ACP methyl ester carboxylesterase